MATRETNDSNSEFLTSSQVRARYGNVSGMWIWRKTDREGFPAPVRIGATSRRYWRTSDLLEWETRVIRADPKGKAPARRKRDAA